MASALGFVIEVFDPTTPGRLCRGRERWIEYETMETEEESTPIHRIIMSGATFSDDRARDARRGIAFGPVGYAPLLQSLLGEGMLVAYCEEGHPQEVPETAAGVEHHTVARPGGSLREWRVRWHVEVTDDASLEHALQAGADVFVVLKAPSDDPASTAHESPLIPPLADEAAFLPNFFNESFASALFLLAGFRSEGRPNRYFQPWGVPAVLEHVDAVALIHRDKHGPALGVYRTAPFDMEAISSSLNQENTQPLLVPFAIPPMLARWDRALSELRATWDTASLGDFPVPLAELRPQGDSWNHDGPLDDVIAAEEAPLVEAEDVPLAEVEDTPSEE
jgi:hypothetical protein